MSLTLIALGTVPGDGTGDPARTGGQKTNLGLAVLNALTYGVGTVTATVPSGNNDSYNPTGYTPGGTMRLILTPTDNTSALLGLAAGSIGDGWPIRIINPSATLSLTLKNAASATPANQFLLPNGGNVVIPPQGAAWFEYVAAVTAWMTL